jgi:hypothetical protein
MSGQVEHSPFKENNETFIQGSYNNLSILVRESDEYINATKLCSDGNRDFRTLKRGQRFLKIIDFWNNDRKNRGVQLCTPLVFLQKVYDRAQGQYIHPELIHFVAEWISIEYSFKVKYIMDTINDYSHATNQTLDETKDQLINQMRVTIEEKDRIIQDQNKIIKIRDYLIDETSVPIDNCNKFLTLFKFGNGFKISANSTHLRKNFLKRFVFSASMNYKQDFKLAAGAYEFENFDEYDDILQIIRDMRFKSEIDGNEVVQVQPSTPKEFPE